MKKILQAAIVLPALMLAGCFGSAEEEIPVKYWSERDKLEGNPVRIVETTVDYREVPAGRPGELYSVATTEYNDRGKAVTLEYVSHNDEQHSYTHQYLYNDNDNIVKRVYSGDDGDYSSEYTWKRKLITRIQYYDEDNEPTSYYKYTYKGNKEVSNGYFNSIGVKLYHTDYVWDGDRVVKQVDQDFEEDSLETYTIEYPADDTEVVTYEVDGEKIYAATIVYNEKGLYDCITWEYPDDEPNGRTYSYEYDTQGNWTKRTVTAVDGGLLWTDEREITY